MRITAFAKSGFGACLLLGATLAFGAEDQAVITFNLPVATYVRQDNPKCNRSLEVSKLLSDQKLHAALIGEDTQSKQVFASIPAVLKQVQKFGGSTDDLLVQVGGDNWSQCESGCVVLPQGARIKEILLSDRKGGNGISILPAQPHLHDPKSSEISGAQEFSTTALDMGDYGYQDLRIIRNDRALCVTAKNWSLVEPTSQTVRVIFSR